MFLMLEGTRSGHTLHTGGDRIHDGVNFWSYFWLVHLLLQHQGQDIRDERPSEHQQHSDREGTGPRSLILLNKLWWCKMDMVALAQSPSPTTRDSTMLETAISRARQKAMTSLLGNQTNRMVGIGLLEWFQNHRNGSFYTHIYEHKNKIKWTTYKKSNGLIPILCSSKLPILCNFI